MRHGDDAWAMGTRGMRAAAIHPGTHIAAERMPRPTQAVSQAWGPRAANSQGRDTPESRIPIPPPPK